MNLTGPNPIIGRGLYRQWLPAILGLLLMATACRPGSNPAEPPLPTIVPAAPTKTPTPAKSLPAVTSVPTASPDGNTPTALPASPTPAAALPTSTPLTVPSPLPSPSLPPAPTPTFTPTAAPPTPTPSQPPLEAAGLILTPVAGGFTKPVFVTHANDGSGRLFVVEQPGRILILKDGQTNPAPFLDIVALVGSDALEQGLLSVAFHPNFAANGYFFVDYTNKQGDTVIARYSVSANPDAADPASAKVLLVIDQPYVNHNGGQLAFGPNGYLYVGTGDGGSANDPHNNGQSLDTLLGKILRLDVDRADPYGVPGDNPFVNRPGARPEIWSFGWRNPWRFSFDRATGDMYIADVGQNQYEEVHVEPAGSPGGQNYGWRLLEGRHCFNPPECDPQSVPAVLPVAEYDHSQGCSVSGGYVYRGTRFPGLNGIYFYGDFCSGIIWGLRRAAGGGWEQARLLQSNLAISSFGQDEAGELYVVDHRGSLFQLGQ